MFGQLFYIGPPVEVLHERYAKQGRIDDRAPVRASHEVWVDAPVERVFALLSDPTRWPRSSPTSTA